LVGVEDVVVEDVTWEPEQGGRVVLKVRPKGGVQSRNRCGLCGRHGRFYDQGRGRRRWRTVDVGLYQAVVEAAAPRVKCPKHGPTVARVPWADHGARHTRVFGQHMAWLAVRCSKSAVCELMRIAWRTVGTIVDREWERAQAGFDPLDGLARIGIDEISYKRGHRYLTVVICHDTGRLVWAGAGRDKKTLAGFFDALGPDRCAKITHITADGADWIATVAAKSCPAAVLCADRFHVVKWATSALDQVRNNAWRKARALARATEPARGRGRPPADAPPRPAHDAVRALKNSRWALWKNPANLTEAQQAKLDWIATCDPDLYQAYLLKEGLRTIFDLPAHDTAHAIDTWTTQARASGLEPFTKLADTIDRHTPAIKAAIEHNMSNGRTESVNTKIRLITRTAYGFQGPQPLIALAMLSLGGHPPTLPGRNHPHK
jgi:transposase